MTTSHDTPHDLVARFVAAFNAGDPDALDRLYEPAAVLVPVPGHPTDDRRGANQYLIGLGQPIRADVRHCYAAGEVALLIVDWAIGEGDDSVSAGFSGAASDVVRRGDDGVWRYLVDNPHGTVGRR